MNLRSVVVADKIEDLGHVDAVLANVESMRDELLAQLLRNVRLASQLRRRDGQRAQPMHERSCLGHAIDDVERQVEAIEIVEHCHQNAEVKRSNEASARPMRRTGHVKRRRCRAFLLEAAHVLACVRFSFDRRAKTTNDKPVASGSDDDT